MKTRNSAPQKLKSYHAERWRSIHQYLKKYFKTGSNKSLHAARVEIKRLTALFHFMAYCNENFDGDKQLKPLQKIFGLLGALRDFKNEALFCRKFNINKAILAKEVRRQADINKELKTKYKKYGPRFRRTEKKANEAIKNIPDGKLKEYLDKTVFNLRTGLSQSVTANMHKNRKKIKEVVYLAKMSETLGKNLLSRTEIDLLDQLQDEMGKWHDIVGFSSKMKRIKDAAVQIKLTGVLQKVEKRLMKMILRLTGHFISAKP